MLISTSPAVRKSLAFLSASVSEVRASADRIGSLSWKGIRRETEVETMKLLDESTCQNCRWWEEKEASRDDWGVCELSGSHSGYPVFTNVLAVAVGNDDQVGSALLETHSDFACVQWGKLEP